MRRKERHKKTKLLFQIIKCKKKKKTKCFKKIKLKYIFCLCIYTKCPFGLLFSKMRFDKMKKLINKINCTQILIASKLCMTEWI